MAKKAARRKSWTEAARKAKSEQMKKLHADRKAAFAKAKCPWRLKVYANNPNTGAHELKIDSCFETDRDALLEIIDAMTCGDVVYGYHLEKV